MYTPEDVAEHLNLHPYTVRKMLREKQFRGAFQIGRRWRVPESALKAWVDSKQAEASAPRDDHAERAG